MKWCLLLHGFLAIWVLVDGLKRKAKAIPWAIGTIILGPIILPIYFTERPRKARELRTGAIVLAVLNIIAIFWALLMAMSGIWREKITTTAATENETLEYKLAILNEKKPVLKDDITLTRFQYLLNQLSNNYGEDPQQIANISLLAHKNMKSCGIDESLLNIMEGLNRLPEFGDMKNKTYAEVITDYVILRSGGQLHNEAMSELQTKIKGY